jgi:predicted DsbA family dithiol-disulfide isomerase
VPEQFPGQIRLVWHNLPLDFHARARPAATAALEAFTQKGNTAFWEMHAAMFESRDNGDRPLLDHDSLVKLARRSGLDVKRFETALQDGRHEAAIEADLALARAAGIDGTPGFVINGRVITGARPLRYFSALVRNALQDNGQ